MTITYVFTLVLIKKNKQNVYLLGKVTNRYKFGKITKHINKYFLGLTQKD